jgi:ABC-type lipoprotein export system ATPase subunit
MSRKILEILLNLNHQKKKTIILITHNNLLEKIANKVIKVIDNQLFIFDNQKISSLEELFPKVF